MAEPSLSLRRLVEQVLRHGSEVPLALLLEQLVEPKRLRALAGKFGLSPKGFRVERAPAHVLAPQLAEIRDAEKLDEILAELRPPPPPKRKSGDDAAHRVGELEALLALRDGELARLRDELERARDATNRAREREAEQFRFIEQLEQELVLQRREGQREAKVSPSVDADLLQQIRALERKVRDLEGEREGLLASDEAMRRQLSHNRSRLREVEAINAELEELIPKSRRRKKKPLPPLLEEERRVIVPRFLPSFYKSLEGKERRSVERAVLAILLFCTEGHSYPGLEVKQLGGQNTWSLRASIGLRIYFRPLPGGDIEVLELADREDQHTALRRLKEK